MGSLSCSVADDETRGFPNVGDSVGRGRRHTEEVDSDHLPSGAGVRVLVAIASYGTKNHAYLQRVIDQYRSMSLAVDVVVLTEASRDFGDDVEVRVGLPSTDPMSLPFGHRALFADRIDSYDVFVYSEDDTLITQRNIEAFLEVDELLPDDAVAGFMRYEEHARGERSYSSVHSCFRWDPASVVRHGPELFAAFTNHHSACCLLTRSQLKRAIASGGFLVAPHHGESSMLVTAATDPYTQCGLRRLVCVTRLEDFLLHHLPDVYLDRLGLDEEGFAAQLEALAGIATGSLSARQLVSPTSRRHGLSWNKALYRRAGPEFEQLVPSGVESVLAVGCGTGDAERAAAGDGVRLVGVPIDNVLGAVARRRGLEVLEPDLDHALERLVEERFDCLLLVDVLHRFDDPVATLRRLRRLLHPSGVVVVSVPNVAFRQLRQFVRQPWGRARGRGARDGHRSGPVRLGRWLRRAGFRPQERAVTFGASSGTVLRRLPGLLGQFLAATVTVRAAVDPAINGATSLNFKGAANTADA